MRRLVSFNRLTCLAIAGAIAGLSGCGGTYDAYVAGNVTLDEKPVPRGTVTFNPVGGGPAAYGRIGEDGNYSLNTGREEGLPTGEYNVTVVSNEPPKKTTGARGGPPPPGKPIAPIWYRTKQTSGLKFTVNPGSNKIPIELSTEPPPGWNKKKRRGRR